MNFADYTNVHVIKNLTGKTVEVKTIDGDTHTGSLYTIDPDTGTIILVKVSGHKEGLSAKGAGNSGNNLCETDEGIKRKSLSTKEVYNPGICEDKGDNYASSSTKERYLATQKTNECSVKIITQHSINNFKVINETITACIPKLFANSVTFRVDSQERKRVVIEWFKQNFLDLVEEGDVLKYGDGVVIEPPYDLDSCYCDNTVVLDRIRTIMSKCTHLK